MKHSQHHILFAAGQRTAVALADGQVVRGHSATVAPDSITLHTQPLGGDARTSQTIPRAAIKLTGTERSGHTSGRTIGTLSGIFLGLGLSQAAASHTSAAAALGGGLAIPVASVPSATTWDARRTAESHG